LILAKRDILESIPKTQWHKEKVKYLFKQFESQSFWKELNVSIELMSPLALCMDWTQSNNATISWTVALLLYCFHFYFNHNSDSGVYMLQYICRCWNYLDKQAYFLHTFLIQCFSTLESKLIGSHFQPLLMKFILKFSKLYQSTY